jgi:Fe-S oxidoreductase
MDTPAATRYTYLKDTDRSSGRGTTGYFAGCMTLLTPATMLSMEKIFAAAGEEVWWADREGGVCCGRPLKLTGEVAAARNMMKHNKELFSKHNITTLIASCPICLKVFKEDYGLKGVEVLHHSEYILRLVKEGRLKLSGNAAGNAEDADGAYDAKGRQDGMNRRPGKRLGETVGDSAAPAAGVAVAYTYHDPCELGRGAGIYDEPRELIRSVGRLIEPEHTRGEALCCGSSLANTVIDDCQQATIARSMAGELERTGADTIVTACPLCKKAIARGTGTRVADISQIVAEAIDNPTPKG